MFSLLFYRSRTPTSFLLNWRTSVIISWSVSLWKHIISSFICLRIWFFFHLFKIISLDIEFLVDSFFLHVSYDILISGISICFYFRVFMFGWNLVFLDKLSTFFTISFSEQLCNFSYISNVWITFLDSLEFYFHNQLLQFFLCFLIFIYATHYIQKTSTFFDQKAKVRSESICYVVDWIWAFLQF